MTRKHLKTCLALVMSLLMLLGSAQAMQITNNIMALNAHRFYTTTGNNAVAKSAEKLSSGYRINRAGDDAAGLEISEKMQQGIKGLNSSAKSSAADGVNLIQTAEGALTEVHAMLQRMTEIAAMQAASNDAPPTEPFSGQWDENSYAAGVQGGSNVLLGMLEHYVDGYQLTQFATDGTDGIIASTNPSAFLVGPTGDIFTVGAGKGQIAMLDGSGNVFGVWNVSTDGESMQVEETTGLEITLNEVVIESLILNGVDAKADLDVREKTAEAALPSSIGEKASMKLTLEGYIAAFGQPNAQQNRLESKISNLSATSENATAAESRIRDVDMADEMTAYTKNNILIQAAQAMLAQANSVPQAVLELLQ